MGVRTASTITASGIAESISLVGGLANRRVSNNGVDPRRSTPNTRLDQRSSRDDAKLIEPDVMRELVTHRARDLIAQHVAVVAEVAPQRVAEDHDPVVDVVAGDAVPPW